MGSLLSFCFRAFSMNGLPSAVTFLGGFLTALFAEPLRRWIFAPRLTLTFGTSSDFLTKTPEFGPGGGHEALYVRIKVVNSRSALAKSCRAYLVNVEREDSSGKFEPTEYCESMQLAWSTQAEQAFSALDLPRDAPHFVDIISTRGTSTAFALATKVTPLRYTNMLATPGIYRFTVIVSGDGVKPGTIRPAVSWAGAWDQVFKI